VRFPSRPLPYIYSRSVSGCGLQLSCWGLPHHRRGTPSWTINPVLAFKPSLHLFHASFILTVYSYMQKIGSNPNISNQMERYSVVPTAYKESYFTLNTNARSHLETSQRAHAEWTQQARALGCEPRSHLTCTMENMSVGGRGDWGWQSPSRWRSSNQVYICQSWIFH
jgi:hypothetical protein